MNVQAISSILLDPEHRTNLLLGSILIFGSSFLMGLLYLFYPAIVAAQHSHDPLLPVQDVSISTTTTTTKENQQQKPQKPLLSIIIPAFNEEERLPVMLRAAYDYLALYDGRTTTTSESNQPPQPHALGLLQTALQRQQSAQTSNNDNGAVTVEWILVSDGSTDDTYGAYCNFCRSNQVQQQQQQQQQQHTTNMLFKFIALPENAGKGAAVQTGMLAATGAYRLMVDADGATDFGHGLQALAARAAAANTATTSNSSSAIQLGSRAHLSRPSFWRRLPSYLFHLLVVFCIGSGASSIQDTQCGFKLFSEMAATTIFEHLHLRRWAFDTEVIYLATHLQNQQQQQTTADADTTTCFQMEEVPVPWTEIEGSKLHTSLWNLLWVATGMLRDMLCVRLCYSTGLWTTKDRQMNTKPSSPQQQRGSSKKEE